VWREWRGSGEFFLYFPVLVQVFLLLTGTVFMYFDHVKRSPERTVHFCTLSRGGKIKILYFGGED
jgi:hypothetical protein